MIYLTLGDLKKLELPDDTPIVLEYPGSFGGYSAIRAVEAQFSPLMIPQLSGRQFWMDELDPDARKLGGPPQVVLMIR